MKRKSRFAFNSWIRWYLLHYNNNNNNNNNNYYWDRANYDRRDFKKVKACFENDLLSTHDFVPEGSVLKIRAVVSWKVLLTCETTRLTVLFDLRSRVCFTFSSPKVWGQLWLYRALWAIFSRCWSRRSRNGSQPNLSKDSKLFTYRPVTKLGAANWMR